MLPTRIKFQLGIDRNDAASFETVAWKIVSSGYLLKPRKFFRCQ